MMTIRQNGGVFGGNPKFTTVGGVLTTAAQPNITSLGVQAASLAFANGLGINFAATPGTGTSELFSDYEEGTWTPVISDAASGGNLGSASASNLLYTKIGRTVVLTAILTNIVTTGMTAGNVLYIQGLPFASNANNIAIGSVSADTVALNTRTFMNAQIGVNASALSFVASGTALTRSNIIVSNITSGTSDISLTISYNV